MDKYQLEIHQPQNGYRYSVDSILLAEFVNLRPKAKVLELGAGCGVIALIVARRFPACTIQAIEIQKGLFEFLKKNIETNHLMDRVQPIWEDIANVKTIFEPNMFDHVITNPPFREPVSGRLCLNAQEALARHEIIIDLDTILKAAFFALKAKGRFSIIYPAERLSFLFFSMSQNRIEPKRLKCIHPSQEGQARMVLVEGVKEGGTELRIHPPLFLNQNVNDPAE